MVLILNLCTITDDGVGRQNSEKLNRWKSSKQKSMGIEITNERINMLNIIEPAKGFSVDIADLEQGTRVTLLIPLN